MDGRYSNRVQQVVSEVSSVLVNYEVVWPVVYEVDCTLMWSNLPINRTF